MWRGLLVGLLLFSGVTFIARAATPFASVTAAGKIAFVRTSPTDDSDSGDIYVVNADGTGERRLTRGPADDGGPSWSPDGRRIAFSRYRCSAAGCDTTIFVMNADGRGLHRLTRWPGEGGAEWSPLGDRFAVVRWVGSRSEIFVMNMNGSAARRLTRNHVDEFSPAWSPDGRSHSLAETPRTTPATRSG